ncbi:hypothetical protein SAMN05216227_102544 [Pseudorhodobacter antarcticus]|jgi:hypothetical protein|uniref:VOC domain-containing protein n=1 Tax=Pseudorhodobacter antarcticus TaxID=1077947 RepID=A0A1H8JHL7_9RHOB|nr:VOC family protein [Pseudorhodobacter antarcticus]SEN80343.1 hypothetical protein SAMN05216227_102544 [Pseudorhodobacter antarcticus]
MTQMVFINIPVSDLDRSKSFFQAIGFTLNLNFADETACCVVIADNINLMVLSHTKFDSFATLPRADPHKTTSVMIALNRDNRAAVDAMVDAALAAGGTEPKPATDHGFMYGRTFQDPDGNVFEPFWMDQTVQN